MKVQSNIIKNGLKQFTSKVLVGGSDYSDLPSKAKYMRELVEEATEDAEKQAHEIVSEAELKASEMLAAAKAKVESIEAEAYQKAYEAGFQAGSEAGMTESTAKADEIFSEMMRGIGEMLQELERLRTETLAREEERTVKFLAMLARKLIQRDLSYDPNTFYELIKQAIARLDNKVDVTIHLNPQSAVKLNELKSKLMAENPGLTTFNIVGEEKLAAGDVILESGQERQDLRIDSQVDELIKTLL